MTSLTSIWFVWFTEAPSQKKPDLFGASSMEGMNPGMAMGGAPATELMMVPDKMVGLIIGRGGEQITRLQAESGCKIQMAQDSQGNLDYKTLILRKVAKIVQWWNQISSPTKLSWNFLKEILVSHQTWTFLKH